MRHLLASKDFREGFIDMLPAGVGLVPFGLVCGVGAAAAGATWLQSLGMSAIIFSGAAQIVTAQMLAADAPFAVIVLTTTVLGLRLLMYSAAIAPYLKPLPEKWQRVLAFMLSDQVFAAAIRRFHMDDDREAAGRHFMGSGVALWITWQVACMAGFFAGYLIPTSWSLEFAVPLCFIALIAPHFKNAPQIAAGVLAAVAVVALDGLPMRLNLIAAGIAGIVGGTAIELARDRWTRR